MTEKYKAALQNIYRSGWGYFNELQENIDEEILSEFLSVGFIICGYTRTRKTWRISSLGRNYVEDLDLA